MYNNVNKGKKKRIREKKCLLLSLSTYCGLLRILATKKVVKIVIKTKDVFELTNKIFSMKPR